MISDIDILIEKKQYEEIKNLMQKFGYKPKHKHDFFSRRHFSPMINQKKKFSIEFHHRLFNKSKELLKEKSVFNNKLKLNGIILSMFDKRNSLSSLIEKEAREYFDTNVYKFNVPRNVTLSEAPSHGLPAIIYDLKCSGSQAYIALAKEFLERGNNGIQ